VNASNVDALLEGRQASHVWSHQLNFNAPEDKNCYNLSSMEQLLSALNRKRGAMVVFVRAGHAIAQESKRSLVDLLDVLACPTPAYTGVEVSAVPDMMQQISFVPGKDAINKMNKKDSHQEEKVSERSERALRKTRILAMDLAKCLQTKSPPPPPPPPPPSPPPPPISTAFQPSQQNAVAT